METSRDVTVVGSVNVDLVYSVASLPLPGETIHSLSANEFLGGKGANQAVSAARLGIKVSFVGKVGNDAHGPSVRNRLEEESIDTQWLTTSTEPTGTAIVLVDQAAENSIVLSGAANMDISVDDVDAARSVIENAAVVVCQYEIPLAAVTRAAELTKGTFILNPAPADAVPADLFDRVDIIVVNETEFEAVFNRILPRELSELSSFVQANVRDDLCVIVTLGADGAMYCQGVTSGHIRPPAVNVVDTTGAGDTFVGAIAEAVSREMSLDECVRWAVSASALSVTSLGAQSGMPTRVELEEFTTNTHQPAH